MHLQVVRQKCLVTDVITYTAAISAREMARQPDNALKLLKEMLLKGLVPGVLRSAQPSVRLSWPSSFMKRWSFFWIGARNTWCETLVTYGAARQSGKAMELHEVIRQESLPHVIVFTHHQYI